jgi:hypothetical protein
VLHPCFVSCDCAPQGVIALLTVRKVNALARRFIVCSSVSSFGTQREHNFENEVYQTQFREEVNVKFVENAGKVNRQFS